jgi:hypothetical protein
MFHVEHSIPEYWLHRKPLFSTWISTLSYPALLTDNLRLSATVPRGATYLSTLLHQNQALPPEKTNN